MDGKQVKGYRTIQWRELRKEIFSRDGYKCTHCGRQLKDKDLQVHHLTYLEGKEAWDYPKELLTTYCKRCHAEEHGKIMPSSGWEYIGYDDLGDLVGECEYCHTDIRYEHYVFHPQWGELTVGAQCADNLTNTNEASMIEKKRKRYANRMMRFIKSSRWKSLITDDCVIYRLKQGEYQVKIREFKSYCTITILFYYISPLDYSSNGDWIPLKSQKEYKTLDDAKIKVFEVIESGKLKRYINEVYLPNHFGWSN